MALLVSLVRGVRARARTGLSVTDGIKIARTEVTRYRRNRRFIGSAGIAVRTALIGISIAVGIGAFLLGAALDTGSVIFPTNPVRAGTAIGFGGLLWLFANRMPTQLDSAEMDHLLPTVSARTVALGKLLASFVTVARPLVLPVICLGVGLGLGLRSIAPVLTIPIAVSGLLALAVLIGGTAALAVRQLHRYRRAKLILILIAFVGSFVLWVAVLDGSVTTALRVEWMRALPPAWFVDLALIGSSISPTVVERGVGALVLVLIGVPGLTLVTTSFAARVWTPDSSRSAPTGKRSHSRSIVGPGFSLWLFGRTVSRPTLTVARKRWLQEQRTPRGLLVVGGYLLPIPAGIGFLLIAEAGDVPSIVPVFAIYIVAVGTGVAFGQSPVATEYPSLPVTMTTITGSAFVRGRILSGVAIGAPVAAVAGFGFGIVSSVGLLEAVVLSLIGALLCLSVTAIGLANGMRVPYHNFKRVPLPLADTFVYAEVGVAPFLRMGGVLAVAALVCSPAFVGYGPGTAVSIAKTIGTDPVVVRFGSLGVTGAIAGFASRLSYRCAVQSYNQYQLP